MRSTELKIFIIVSYSSPKTLRIFTVSSESGVFKGDSSSSHCGAINWSIESEDGTVAAIRANPLNDFTSVKSR